MCLRCLLRREAGHAAQGRSQTATNRPRDLTARRLAGTRKPPVGARDRLGGRTGINRLTASEIVTILTNADLVDDEVETDAFGDTDPDQVVRPGYRSQSDDDIWAVRLLVKAVKLAGLR